MLAGEDGARRAAAFAAPRNGDIWDDVRPQIAAEIARHGGTATEAEGRWGTELRRARWRSSCRRHPRTQPSRCIGVNGPRWLLRATLLGRPAVEYREDGGA